ncbi:FMN-binding glutamate synthase family protein [Persicimonas caeni]|uniref:FMN-binding glutamate synthase family protein n=1 Tax=Persicimonas caeni TaxID=2292766 RepID=A0A4Y6PRZ1_PERCE|nr:FMN-binding glutamate synthase family protein [Persicimonas caeni]QDG50555.1 FMN-binding glutamate synthase family protein [Persicimonas caeni]QED31776.1 FMN-binding glutamate synthase family protein [Persicimonas caeni]
MGIGTWILIGLGGFLLLVALYDLFQRKHAILRNFPVIGHLRYILESVGPELRQYIVTDNDSERPFNRDERRWVYASSKKQNNYFGFGSDNSIDLLPNYLVIKHSAFPFAGHDQTHCDPTVAIPCSKVWGAARGRAKAFRPDTTVYISAMSFGSLSAAAVESLNKGAAMAKCLHNTGEGSISKHHDHGADLVWQIGTGYFGCRDAHGNFCLDELLERVERFPVRALEIKLSQGAKPGHGGVLPAEKITPEIAKIRGIPMGKDCLSPAGHSAFSNTDELLDFVEMLADATGLPVGIKSAVGDLGFWVELADMMQDGERGVDFITIDGGEGGTGAAPLAFADHVSYPFKTAFPRVYRIFAERGLADDVVFVGSGKLGFPQTALFAYAMGCDMVAVAREAMLSIGCIQAQRCHTGHCPAGVATQNKWLMRGLDPTLKSARFANYVATLQSEILDLTHACGLPHPALVTLDHFDVLDDNFSAHSARDVFSYEPSWGLPPRHEQERIWQEAGHTTGLAERSAAE